MRAVYDEHIGRYGYRRISFELYCSLGTSVNHHRVQRLTQKMALRALIRLKKRSRNIPGLATCTYPTS